MPAIATKRLLPVASILLGASLWGIIWYPMRLLEAAGLGGLWLTLTLYASALLASFPFLFRSLAEFPRRPYLLTLLMLAAGWTNISFVEAVLHGNILRVLLLFYLSPIWAVVLGRIFLGESLSRASFLSLVLAMSGALIMLWDIRTGTPWPRDAADWMALSSGFAFALSNVLARGMSDISVKAKSFAVWGGVVLLAIFIIPFVTPELPTVSTSTMAGAVALGVVGILCMTLLVQFGVSHLAVQRSAVLSLVELVVGAVSQQLLTNEQVVATDWLGGALILGGAWLAAQTGGKE